MRLKYIGKATGAVTFRVNGKVYRGGTNPVSRFLDVVSEDDARILVETGDWEYVSRNKGKRKVLFPAAPTVKPVAPLETVIQPHSASIAPKSTDPMGKRNKNL